MDYVDGTEEGAVVVARVVSDGDIVKRSTHQVPLVTRHKGAPVLEIDVVLPGGAGMTRVRINVADLPVTMLNENLAMDVWQHIHGNPDK